MKASIGYIDDLGVALKVVVWGWRVPYDYVIPKVVCSKDIRLPIYLEDFDQFPYVVQRVYDDGKLSSYGEIFIVEKVENIHEEEINE